MWKYAVVSTCFALAILFLSSTYSSAGIGEYPANSGPQVWERINQTNTSREYRERRTTTERLWVQGGWLVKYETSDGMLTVTFVEDVLHKWKIQ